MRAALIAAALAACGGRSSSEVPPELDAWARGILAMPITEVCVGDVRDEYFCELRPALVTDAVRKLGAHTITIQAFRHGERYLDVDLGGGFVEAHGFLIGPAGWMHGADAERKERKIRDGVYAYDTRP